MKDTRLEYFKIVLLFLVIPCRILDSFGELEDVDCASCLGLLSARLDDYMNRRCFKFCLARIVNVEDDHEQT